MPQPTPDFPFAYRLPSDAAAQIHGTPAVDVPPVTTADSTPAADDAGAPVVAPPPRRVLPRLAAAGVAAALLAGGVATAPAEPSSPEPVAFRQGWPVKWTGA